VQPYWLVRTFSGVMMDVGMTLLVYNLMRTALAADGAARATPPAAAEGAA
jgi:cytochrome c oxidase cbb3-type subunit 1